MNVKLVDCPPAITHSPLVLPPTFPAGDMFAFVYRAGARTHVIGRRRAEHRAAEAPEMHSTFEEAPRRDWRHRAYNLLEDPTSSPAAKAISIFILLTIAISIINFMISSYPWDLCSYAGPDKVRVCAKPPHAEDRLDTEDSIKTIESVCIIIFTLEYLLRLTVCTARMSRLRFLIDPLNLLDVLAIFPWYLDIIVNTTKDSSDSDDSGGGVFGVLRIVRLTRVLRVFKVSRSMQGMLVLVRTLKRSFSAFMILLSSIMVSMLLFGSFLVFFERGTYVRFPNEASGQYLRDDGSPSPFLSIPHCMYWCMVRALPLPALCIARPCLVSLPSFSRTVTPLQSHHCNHTTTITPHDRPR